MRRFVVNSENIPSNCSPQVSSGHDDHQGEEQHQCWALLKVQEPKQKQGYLYKN